MQTFEKNFSIGNTESVFEILRSKMYSDPILAVCREYSCNAKDANIENEKASIPITITIPTKENPFFKVKDSGKGISPDDIEKIYIQYGVSTKTTNQDLVGSFGTGSKSSFAYTDNFQIITIINSIKYEYKCFMDKSNICKIALVSENSTEEPSGTEIIVPVKPNDINLFIEKTLFVVKHWEVTPTFINFNYLKSHDKPIMHSDNWRVYNKTYNSTIKIIVNDIEYNFSTYDMNYSKHSKLLDMRLNVELFFNKDEITLSSSREKVFLNDKTKANIDKRLLEVSSYIDSAISMKLDCVDDLYTANINFKKLKKSILADVYYMNYKWRNTLLSGNILVGCVIQTFYKQNVNNVIKYKSNFNPTYLACLRNTDIYINDLYTDLTPKHVKFLFEEKPSLENIQILCPTLAELEDVLAKCSDFKYKLLSEVIKSNIKPVKKSIKCIIYKLSDFNFDRSSIAEFEKNTNIKIMCPLVKDGPVKSAAVKDIKVSSRIWKSLINLYPQYDFYGIDEDILNSRKEDFEDYKSLSSLIDVLKANNSVDLLKFKHLYNMRSNLVYNSWIFNDTMQSYLKVGSLAYNFIELIKELHQVTSSDIVSIVDYFYPISLSDVEKWGNNNPQYNVIKYQEDINAKYPLLRNISLYYKDELMIEHIAKYLNSVEET